MPTIIGLSSLFDLRLALTLPVLLRQLRQPTFVTIDMGFWRKGLRDIRYCVLACWSVKELGITEPEVAEKLALSPSAAILCM